MSTPEDLPSEDWRPDTQLVAPGRSRAGLTKAALIALGPVIGTLSGPFLSAVVNHGRPGVASLVALPFFLLFGAIYLRTVMVRGGYPWPSALARAATALIGGGVLFMLPHSLALPAAGDFWWRTDTERWAVYSAPYLFVAWLAFARRGRRWIPTALIATLAAGLVMAWPKFELGATAQTAALLRNELNFPAASLYTVGFPGARPTDGYYADRSIVSITYAVSGYARSTSTRKLVAPIGYDFALTVYPAGNDTSPCADLGDNLSWVLPDSYGTFADYATCERLPNGRWQYSEQIEPGHVVQVERVGGYFIALTVNTQITGLEEQFPALFTGLHHPNAAELVAVGLDDNAPLGNE